MNFVGFVKRHGFIILLQYMQIVDKEKVKMVKVNKVKSSQQKNQLQLKLNQRDIFSTMKGILIIQNLETFVKNSQLELKRILICSMKLRIFHPVNLNFQKKPLILWQNVDKFLNGFTLFIFTLKHNGKRRKLTYFYSKNKNQKKLVKKPMMYLKNLLNLSLI